MTHDNGLHSVMGTNLIHLEDQASLHAAFLNILKILIDRLESACLTDYVRPHCGVQVEHFLQIEAGSDNRALDPDAIEHRLKDGKLDEVVCRQRNEDDGASTPQRTIRLLERLG